MLSLQHNVENVKRQQVNVAELGNAKVPRLPNQACGWTHTQYLCSIYTSYAHFQVVLLSRTHTYILCPSIIL